jgi:dihydroorotase-like cyclic amidohydrolase
MKMIIRHGRVIDPANNRDEVADLFISDGRIVASQSEIGNQAECRPRFQDRVLTSDFCLLSSGVDVATNLASTYSVEVMTLPAIDIAERLRAAGLRPTRQRCPRAFCLTAATATSRRSSCMRRR